MYLTILRLILPYAQKIAAQQITDYLNRRREDKVKDAETKEKAKEIVEDAREGTVKCPPCPSPKNVAGYNLFSTTNTIFFALSGVLLGTALTAIFYVFWKDISLQE